MKDYFKKAVEDVTSNVIDTCNNLYSQGVVDGVKLVIGFMESDDPVASDIVSLKEVLDGFVKKYTIYEDAPNDTSIASNDIKNRVLEDTDESEGNVYNGYIIPTFNEYISQYEEEKIEVPNNVIITDPDYTVKIETDIKFSDILSSEDRDNTLKERIKSFIDNHLKETEE